MENEALKRCARRPQRAALPEPVSGLRKSAARTRAIRSHVTCGGCTACNLIVRGVPERSSRRQSPPSPERCRPQSLRRARYRPWCSHQRALRYRRRGPPKGLLQVPDQVVRMLDADGQPDQALGDPGGARTAGGTPEWVVEAG